MNVFTAYRVCDNCQNCGQNLQNCEFCGQIFLPASEPDSSPIINPISSSVINPSASTTTTICTLPRLITPRPPTNISLSNIVACSSPVAVRTLSLPGNTTVYSPRVITAHPVCVSRLPPACNNSPRIIRLPSPRSIELPRSSRVINVSPATTFYRSSNVGMGQVLRHSLGINNNNAVGSNGIIGNSNDNNNDNVSSSPTYVNMPKIIHKASSSSTPRSIFPASVQNNNTTTTVGGSGVSSPSGIVRFIPLTVQRSPRKTTPRIPAKRRRNNQVECFTISSDDESSTTTDDQEGPDDPRRRSRSSTNSGENTGDDVTLTSSRDVSVTSSRDATMTSTKNVYLESSGHAIGGNNRLVVLHPVDDVKKRNDSVMLRVRSTRFGTFKIQNVVATFRKNRIELGGVRPIDSLTTRLAIHLGAEEITTVIACFNQQLNVMFVYITDEAARKVRVLLNMESLDHKRMQALSVDEADRNCPYFDPASSNPREKRLTLLFDGGVAGDQRIFLQSSLTRWIRFVDLRKAQDILCTSSPLCSAMETPLVVDCNDDTKTETNQESAVNNSADEKTALFDETEQPDSTKQSTGTGKQQTSEDDKPRFVTLQPLSSNSPAVSTRLQARISSGVSRSYLVPDNMGLCIYPPAPATGGISITVSDLRCLAEEEFLNDVIIDFYLKYMVNEVVPKEVAEKTFVFSSFFYPRLTQRLRGANPYGIRKEKRHHDNVKTWTRHVDLFSKDFVVIPINQNSHWFVAIVCFPGDIERYAVNNETSDDATPKKEMNESKKDISADESVLEEVDMDDDEVVIANAVVVNDESGTTAAEEEIPETPPGSQQQHDDTSAAAIDTAACSYILILDSLKGSTACRQIFINLRDYMSEEWIAKRGGNSSIRLLHAHMPGFMPDSPRQDNYSDCGLYLLQNVESFLKEPPKHGESNALMLSRFKRLFAPEMVANKRREIHDLIIGLHRQQNPNSTFNPKFEDLHCTARTTDGATVTVVGDVTMQDGRPVLITTNQNGAVTGVVGQNGVSATLSSSSPRVLHILAGGKMLVVEDNTTRRNSSSSSPSKNVATVVR